MNLLHDFLSDGLLVMLATVLLMCATCWAFVWWLVKQPMPGAVEFDEEQSDERSQRRHF